MELIDLVNSVIIFLSQTTLLRWLTFLLRSQTVIFIILLFLISFFLLMLLFVLQWLSLHWEILIMLLSHFPLTFHQVHNGISCFIAQLMTILVLIGTVFMIIGTVFFKLSVSVAVSVFCEWVQVGIDLYIPHRKYQVKPHSSPWFSVVFAAAIVLRNHFFCLYQQNKSSESKEKFRQASNFWKRVLEAAKFVYGNKTKESITFRNLALSTFGELPIVFSTK